MLQATSQVPAARQSTRHVESVSQVVAQLVAPLQSMSHRLSSSQRALQAPPSQFVRRQVASSRHVVEQFCEPLQDVLQVEKYPLQLLMHLPVPSQSAVQSPSSQVLVQLVAFVQSVLQFE